MADSEAMTFEWAVGDDGGRPCLLAWVNGFPLVVPLHPPLPGMERARFVMLGYHEDSAATVEQACAGAVSCAVAADMAGCRSRYAGAADGVVRFFGDWGAADPEASARAAGERVARQGADALADGRPVHCLIPPEALRESPLSEAAVAAREARDAETLRGFPDPEDFQGENALILRAARQVREAARRYGDPESSLVLMADKSALRALEAVRGEGYPMDEAASLVRAVAGLMLRMEADGDGPAGWLDGLGLEAAVAALGPEEGEASDLGAPAP